MKKIDPRIGRKRPEHSNLMKILYKKGKLLGLKRTHEELSISAKKWIKEKGHPKGMLGKKQTEKSIAKAREMMITRWQDKTSRMNTKEYRQILSDRAKEQHKNGQLNNGYSRGKMGTYNIKGKRMFFRSLWEVNYALYLNFLIKQKQIKKWKYEVDTFWFEKIRRGVRSYKPDFKIFNFNNTIEYHEVKGWMDPKSKTKISRMAKYYPKIKLIIIEKESYKDIKRKVGKLLGFYT